MLVTRRPYDAAAAGCVGVGVVLIALKVKPIPSVIGYLGWFAYPWVVLMLVASVSAVVGSLLRTRDLSRGHRREWSVGLEKFGWLFIAGCALVFVLGVLYQFGFIEALLTLGWSMSTALFCLGHWRDLHPPRRTRDTRKP